MRNGTRGSREGTPLDEASRPQEPGWRWHYGVWHAGEFSRISWRNECLSVACNGAVSQAVLPPRRLGNPRLGSFASCSLAFRCS